jgi:hypothetical protein
MMPRRLRVERKVDGLVDGSVGVEGGGTFLGVRRFVEVEIRFVRCRRGFGVHTAYRYDGLVG